jgi:hypothetical protein
MEEKYIDNIPWADYCIHWSNSICTIKKCPCPWSDIGGYPINTECQFYKNKYKNLTNGQKYDII